MRKLLIIMIALLAIAPFNNAKASKIKMLSPKQMKKDLDYFFDFVERVHPNPYVYTSKATIDNKKLEIYEACLKPMSKIDFVRLLAPLNSFFDGHSGISLWQTIYTIGGDVEFFPKPVRFENKTIYIDNLSNKDRFNEVVSINGISAQDIYKKLLKTTGLENQRHKELAIEGCFAQCLYLFGEITSPFKIKFKDEDKMLIDSCVLMGVPKSEIKNTYVGNDHDNKLDYRIYENESIAIVDYNSSSYDIRKKNVDKLLDYKFNKILKELNDKNIQTLFIDVSRNGGGAELANNYLLEIIKNDTTWFPSINVSIKISKDYMKTYANYYTKSFLHRFFKKNNLGPIGSLYENTSERWGNFDPDGFDKKIYLIQGAQTYSAGVDVVRWFNETKVATIIGEETGGTADEVIQSIIDRLPKSKIKIKSSCKYLDYQDGDLYNGYMPQVPLELDYYKSKYELPDLQRFLKEIEKYTATLKK